MPRLLLALALAFAVLAPAAYAGDPVTVPPVVGKSEADAKAAVEGLGLVVRTELQAGHDPGKILSQSPPPGTQVEQGDEVTLRICCSANIKTKAPNVMGMTEAEAKALLADAYVLSVAYVTGDADKAGLVVKQDPTPDADVLYRDEFAIEIVRNSVVVPGVVGQTVAKAHELLHGVGLLYDTLYVKEDVAARGTVISQDPRSDTEILPGATIVLRVVGPAPEGGAGGPDQVGVPNVVGFAMHLAEEALLAVGLVPHVFLVDNPGKPAFSVLTQDIEPGKLADAGQHVHLNVAKAPAPVAQVHLPSLYGLTEAESVALLQAVGLKPLVKHELSVLPAGTVISQAPGSGKLVDVGSHVSIRIAKVPPPAWTPPLTTVPNLNGLTATQARVSLLLRGLSWRQRKALGPGLPLHRVFKQSHAPGHKVQVGMQITYYLPYQSQVPQLLNKTKAQAVALLQADGLNPLAQSLPIGFPPTQVISQSVGAGNVVSRGSEITFVYKWVGLPPQTVTVPNLLNKSTAAAEFILVAKGLVAKLQGPQFGIGSRKVIGQNPTPGMKVAKGTEVTVFYKYTGAVLLKVHVPNVVNQSRGQAKVLIENAALKALAQGPVMGIGVTKVTSQWPPAGTKVIAGTTVKFNYIFTGFAPIPIAKVTVPNLVNKTLTYAKQYLQAKGLSWSAVGPQFGVGQAVVKAQSPGGGAKVLPGTSITLFYKFGAVVVPLATVPKVTGLKKNQAAQKLALYGFKVKWFYLGTKKAIAQSPGPGAKRPKGSYVTVTLGP